MDDFPAIFLLRDVVVVVNVIAGKVVPQHTSLKHTTAASAALKASDITAALNYSGNQFTSTVDHSTAAFTQ